MPSQDSSRQSVTTLNALRRQAVELRLAGNTLAETQKTVGLSVPTIIAAVKAYREGGWEAVDVGPRGRPRADSAVADLSSLHLDLLNAATSRPESGHHPIAPWSSERVSQWLESRSLKVSRSTVLSWLNKWSLQPGSRYRRLMNDKQNVDWRPAHERFCRRARRRGTPVYWIGSRKLDADRYQLYAHDLRGHAYWCLSVGIPKAMHYLHFLQSLRATLDQQHPDGIALVLPGEHISRDSLLGPWLQTSNTETLIVPDPSDRYPTGVNSPAKGMTRARTSATGPPAASIPSRSLDKPARRHPIHSNHSLPLTKQVNPIMTTPSEQQTAESPAAPSGKASSTRTLTHLQRLEAESIHIMREVVAEADNPVMLYSIGKDSAVMLHLARKAFFPAVPPFPLLHVDTGWKFKAMYEFRDSIVKEYGMELLTHINPEGLAQKVNPFTHGSALHTDIMKTQGLKQALDEHRFDIAFGGARRDEEKSRAKERVFSFRSAQHRWDAKNQRPELWSLYNARKKQDESIRVFPISNWTELDIWQYIHRENIPIVPLYLAAERPVVNRDGTLIMVDDDRMPMQPGEVPEMRNVRFRTLGCYPLTGAVESTATTLEEIIQEMLLTRTSERQGRMIDHDSAASMEKKKQEGYF